MCGRIGESDKLVEESGGGGWELIYDESDRSLKCGGTSVESQMTNRPLEVARSTKHYLASRDCCHLSPASDRAIEGPPRNAYSQIQSQRGGAVLLIPNSNSIPNTAS